MSVITDAIAGIFKPVADVIDHVTMSGDDKAKLQQQIVGAQIAVASQSFDYEMQLLKGQQSIIQAEAQGNGVLQRNWRPITMLVFLALVVADSLNWLPNKLAPQAWTLLQYGLGGYTIGRSVEKIVPSIATALKKS